jgi:hypothetical protein
MRKSVYILSQFFKNLSIERRLSIEKATIEANTLV